MCSQKLQEVYRKTQVGASSFFKLCGGHGSKLPSGFPYFRANRAPLPLDNCLASGNANGGTPIPDPEKKLLTKI